MKRELSVKLKYGGWGAAVGAAVILAIGFSVGGWVTASTADEMSDEAVLASRSAICVAQFMSAPDHQEKLTSFQNTDRWRQYRFVEDGGWDKMPGETNARTQVSRACADGIRVLVNK